MNTPQREAINSGMSDESVKSKPKTSIANNMAAIGTLKIAAKAAAQAHAKSNIRFDWLM